MVEVDERVRADGTVEKVLDLEAARRDLERAKADGINAVAIVFMHAYSHPAHEQAVAKLARDMGFAQVSVSHEISPLIKLVGRGDTTVVDAYLSPILRRYVARVDKALDAKNSGARLMFMMSSGGLTAAELFQGKDAILSGPAGGVVGMAQTGHEADFNRLIGFDMGGTSTDVSHYDGEYERAFETEVAGVRMRAPMMLIHTVAAGGGSILHYDGARFRVGPDLAGANPGPKCYRRGGPLAVTDANVMVGKLIPDFFPKIFGPNQDEPLDAKAVRHDFNNLAQKIILVSKSHKSAEEIADGFIKIAVENMANAIKKISVQRGYDVTRYALNCFGGAGGQHACLVADALGMTRVLIHPFSSLLSAYGMGLADIRATRQQAIEQPFGGKSLAVLKSIGGKLGKDVKAEVAGQGVPAGKIKTIMRAHIRYAGTDTALIIDAGPLPKMKMRLREGSQIAVRLHRPQQAARDRGGFGRSGRRRRALSREEGQHQARQAAEAGATHQILLSRRVAQCQRLHARPAFARRPRARPRHHHRAAPDHRGRARLAHRHHGEGPFGADPRQCRSNAPMRSAPRPIRSCWKCSTTSSCRSPSRWAYRCRTPPIR